MRTFTCIRPAAALAACPANVTAWPPEPEMKAVTGTAARGSETGLTMAPSGGAGVSEPPPETNTVITSPGAGVFDVVFTEKALKAALEMKSVALSPKITGDATVTGTCVDATGAPSRFPAGPGCPPAPYRYSTHAAPGRFTVDRYAQADFTIRRGS